MNLTPKMMVGLASLSLLVLAPIPSHAQVTSLGPGVLEYGDEDQSGAGALPVRSQSGSDPVRSRARRDHAGSPIRRPRRV